MAPTFDFDRVIDRRATASNKWRKFPPRTCCRSGSRTWTSPRRRAGRSRAARARRARRVRLRATRSRSSSRCSRTGSQKRYGWRVGPEAVVLLPGVIPGFNMALRVLDLAGRRAPGAGAGLSADPALARQHELTPRRGTARARRATAATRWTRRVRAPPSTPAPAPSCSATRTIRWAASSRATELAGMAQICLGATCRSSPTRSTATCSTRASGTSRSPRSAPRSSSARSRLMAPSKTFNLAGLKCVSAVVIPTLRCASDSWPPRRPRGQIPTSSASPPPSPPIATADAWLDALHASISRPTATTGGVRARALPRRRGPSARRPVPRLARLPGRGNLRQRSLHVLPGPARVALNDGVTFGPGGQGFARLNFGCPRALLTEGLDRMRDAFRRRPR